jgi:hypothetical protein
MPYMPAPKFNMKKILKGLELASEGVGHTLNAITVYKWVRDAAGGKKKEKHTITLTDAEWDHFSAGGTIELHHDEGVLHVTKG